MLSAVTILGNPFAEISMLHHQKVLEKHIVDLCLMKGNASELSGREGKLALTCVGTASCHDVTQVYIKYYKCFHGMHSAKNKVQWATHFKRQNGARYALKIILCLNAHPNNQLRAESEVIQQS